MDKKKVIIFLGIFLAFLARAGFVLALEAHYPTVFGVSLNETSTFAEYGCYFFALIMNLAFFVAVIVVAFGGVYYLVSYSRGKFTDEGKDWIKAGILGLLIIVCSSLIAHTINPDLNNCKLAFLPGIDFKNSESSTDSPGIPTVSYQEIPIGTLTENLLTKTTECYAFDPKGDPIEGEKIKTDDGQEMAGPTYLKHDLADCLSQLADGAQKKAQVIGVLSNKIVKLMNTCDCQKYGQCDDTCGGKCNTPLSCGNSAVCEQIGPCVKGACKQHGDIQDCCPKDSGIKDPASPSKNLSVKALIEHGPIAINVMDNCCKGASSGTDPEDPEEEPDDDKGECGDGTDMKDCGGGIKSCSCPSSYNGNSSYTLASLLAVGVEVCSKAHPAGYCSLGLTCVEGVCKDKSATTPGSTSIGYAGLDEFRCPNPKNTSTPCSDIANFVEKQVQLDKKTIKIIDPQKWNQLNLLQQLMYYQEKMDQIKQKIQKDINKLDEARSALDRCYLAVPYVDLLKTQETTNEQQRLIKVEKTFTDPETSSLIDASKYCKGFNYAYSSCFKKCNDLCPDSSNEAIQLYQQCEKCDGGDAECIRAQKECIKDKYNSRPCTYNTQNPSQKFGECVSSCQSDCTSACSKKYTTCSSEYKICQNLCKSESQCVLDNTGVCLFGSEGIVECSNQNTGPGETKYCISNSYLCKNGSDEYAGYQDCASSSSAKEYSASYFFDNPNKQKCPDPYGPAKSGSACYSQKNTSTACQKMCPETQKCPASSRCPNCPCDQIDTTLKYCIPGPDSGEEDADEPADPVETGPCEGGKPLIKCPDGTMSCHCPSAYIGNNSYLLASVKSLLAVGVEVCSPAHPTGYCSLEQTCVDGVCKSAEEEIVGDDEEDDEDDPVAGSGDEIILKKVSAHQVVGPQCNEYSYNDDPLTFYCENSWWTNPDKEGNSVTPIGTERTVPEGREVPVGQMVDGARDWANWIVNEAGKKIGQDTQQIITLIKQAGDAYKTPPVQNYCKCEAKYETGQPICTTNCSYGEQWTKDSKGRNICVPSCTFIPCTGNPCEQLINYLSGVWDSYKQLKIDQIDFSTVMLTEPRSDIMKKLTYSRKKTSDCSLINSAYKSSTRLLSCTRVEDELIAPVNTNNIIFQGKTVNAYCYGSSLGKLFGKDLTDNWFCAEQKADVLTPGK